MLFHVKCLHLKGAHMDDLLVMPEFCSLHRPGLSTSLQSFERAETAQLLENGSRAPQFSLVILWLVHRLPSLLVWLLVELLSIYFGVRSLNCCVMV